MSNIYLHPMMEVFQSNRGHVSIIFGMLPAITLISGQIFLFIRQISFNILFSFLGPIATILLNTYGRRKITVIGACLAVLGFCASSLYANIWFYYISFGIIGVIFIECSRLFSFNV